MKLVLDITLENKFKEIQELYMNLKLKNDAKFDSKIDFIAY
jgi:hypothetical protein